MNTSKRVIARRARTILSALLFAAASVNWLAVLCPLSACAQGGVPLWTNRYNGPANGNDSASAIAVDSNGNVFITGRSGGNGSAEDYVTVKYSNIGVPMWTNRYNGPGNDHDYAEAIAVDSNGDVIVAGRSWNGTNMDYATIKYSGAGAPLWTNRYGGEGNSVDVPHAIALDATGNVFVTGRSAGNPQFGDYATVAYTSAGVPLWTNLYNGPGSGNDEAFAIAVDTNGKVFVTGYSEETPGSALALSYATVAYSNDGVPLWTGRYSGSDNGPSAADAVAVDSSNCVFVTGVSDGDFATIKYSNAGVPLWTNRYHDSANGYARGEAMAVDNNGNVLVTGQSYLDYATVKYSNAGVPLWTNRNTGNRIAVDRQDNVFVTSGGYFAVGISSAGMPLWTNTYPGAEGLAIITDKNGNVFVTGDGPGSGGGADYLTIKYSSSVPAPRLDFQKQNNQLVLSWTNAGFNLQSAPAVTGPFTNLPSATSPYTNSLTAPQQFFRLMGN